MKNILFEENFYFVHKYHAVLDEDIDCCTSNFYNVKINSIVNKNNIFGIQFHPEKSHIPGNKILENFVSI